MGALISEIIDDAQTIIGEVAGPGVQMFSEDKLLADAVRSFNLLFKKYYWDQYLEWNTVVLDGTTGKPTTDAFTFVKDFEDFLAVCPAGKINRLPVLSKLRNPNTISGTSPLCWTSLSFRDTDFTGKRIKIYPITSTGSIDVLARIYPLGTGEGEEGAIQFAADDRFELDRDMLSWGTAYFSLVGDALNADAAEMCKTMMETKYRDILAALANQPVSVRGGDSIPRDWFVSSPY